MTRNKTNINSLFAKRFGGGGETVIFIHGYGVSSKSWYDIVPYIEENFDIHFIDLMGFGNSPAPVNWSYSIEAQAVMILKYLMDNKLKDIFLVGHSYGGGVSVILNHILKKEETIRIKKLVLISPAVYHQTLPFFIKLSSIPLVNRIVISILPADYQVRFVLEHIFYNKHLVTNERVSRYVGNISGNDKREAFIKISENIIPDLSDDEIDLIIEDIDMPVKIVYGDHDNVIPMINIQKLNDALNNSELIIIEECGHVPQEEYPEKVANEIRIFLEK